MRAAANALRQTGDMVDRSIHTQTDSDLMHAGYLESLIRKSDGRSNTAFRKTRARPPHASCDCRCGFGQHQYARAPRHARYRQRRGATPHPAHDVLPPCRGRDDRASGADMRGGTWSECRHHDRRAFGEAHAALRMRDMAARDGRGRQDAREVRMDGGAKMRGMSR